MSHAAHGKLILDEVSQTFREQKAMADKAVAQVSDEKLHVSLHPETNSIAVVMKDMRRLSPELAGVIKSPKITAFDRDDTL